MLERLQWKTSFFELSAETVYAVIQFKASVAGVGCIRDVVVLEVS